jgi:protein TonB
VDTTKVYENKPGQVDRVAKKRSGNSPSYPDRAPRLKSGERVSVTFTFLVTEDGAVRDVEVMESAGKLIDDVVVEAVRTWRYDPARIRGVPVRVRVVRKQTFLGG